MQRGWNKGQRKRIREGINWGPSITREAVCGQRSLIELDLSLRPTLRIQPCQRTREAGQGSIETLRSCTWLFRWLTWMGFYEQIRQLERVLHSAQNVRVTSRPVIVIRLQ